MAHDILIIDDDETILKALKEFFEKAGYSVIATIDGESGILAYERYNPRVVISDCLLPKMDGFQVCTQVKKRARGPLVFILMSAIYTEQAFIKETIATYTPDAFLTKPFDLNALLKFIRKENFKTPQPAKPFSKPLERVEVKLKPTRAEKIEMLGDDEKTIRIIDNKPSKKMNLSGNLRDTSFFEILNSINNEEATGILTILNGEVERKFFLYKGVIVKTHSNDDDELFGNVAIDMEYLEESDIKEHEEEIDQGNQKIGQIMVDNEILTPEEVLDILYKQALIRLNSVIEENEGSYNYQPAIVKEVPTVYLELSIFDYLSKYLFEDDEFLINDLIIPFKDSIPFFTEENKKELSKLKLDSLEKELILKIDGKNIVKNLIFSSSDKIASERFIFALITLKYVTLK